MFIDILGGIAIGFIVAIAVFFIRSARKKAILESFNLSLLLVRIPREDYLSSNKRDFKDEINKFENLLSGLTSIRRPIIFEAAVPHIGEGIHFYLAVPGKFRETALNQIHGLWNGASVEHIKDDYSIFNPSGSVAGAYVVSKQSFALPIRTYREINEDSFSLIAGGFSEINEIGEGAALQVIISSADSSYRRKINDYVKKIKSGASLAEVVGGDGSSFSGFKEALIPKKQEEKEDAHQIKSVDEGALKTLEAKMSKPIFMTNIRILASSGSPFQAENILGGMTSGFSQFSSPSRNELKIVKPRNLKKLIHNFCFRSFSANQAVILNSEEIASLFHFPTSFTETPKIEWLKAKESPPPDNLPDRGLFIGRSNFRGEGRPIYITEEDKGRHIYIVGQTGTGKSTLLANMIIDEIKRGGGVAMIDPHGDLTEGVLEHIPSDRLADVIYFNPSDLDKPLGLNMIDHDPNRPEEKTFIVNEMQSIFNKLFPPETMGPMFEQYMRNSLLLLMEDINNEPATLIEIPRVLTDPEYRNRKLARIHNPVVIDFWKKEVARAGGDASLVNMTPYITSKFNNFIANDYIRPIIGQPKSVVNFRQIMDGGKILLVNLSKGRIGDINAGLLGMIISGKILMAALSRADLPEGGRRGFSLYVDEFQNFTTDLISAILSEARKYKLSLVMAHQFIAQLTEKTRDAVFGNVGSQIAFRVGVQDAEFLVKQFEPVFGVNDLVNIDNFNAYVKILVRGETSRPFNIKTLPFESGDGDRAFELKKMSREKYGRDRVEVEEGIYRRLRG